MFVSSELFVSSVVVFSVLVLFSDVVVFFDFTYVLLTSSNLLFPSLLNAISKYTDVPDFVVLYNTLEDCIELLSNNTSFVSLSII